MYIRINNFYIMQKILVTGASGFVGSRFVSRWALQYDLLTPSHAELDICDAASVDAYVARNSPDVILHCAALANTWYCEQHPEESYRVNVEGTVNLARAARNYGAKLVFFSSDQIYNGNQEWGLLSEDVAVAPENYYGCHKLEAEQKALEIVPDAVALRATWMYDAVVPGAAPHPDFVQNVATAIKENKPLVMPVREYRGITWVKEVVDYLPYTFSLQGGVYNFGSENKTNSYETACCYCEMLGQGSGACNLVVPDYERYPAHERNLSISTDKIFRASGGRICFTGTIDGMRIFLDVT